MQAAIDLTIGALSLVHRDLDSYQYSYEIEAAISHHIISHGGLDAWTPIIGAGKNSCILHSSERRTRLQRNDLVVIDIGADVEHYCADITRSYVLGGKPSMRQQAVYDAVLETHSYGCSLQQPGSLIRENERLVEAFIGRKMMALGLITQSERSAIRKYFPHATSHYLGLDPHDAGDYDQPLQAGMVVTVEPGIYIPEEEIGIRIEDDVLITESGNVIMSEGIPRTLS
jgi:Xaa-Pro aminopeptidase